MKRILSIGFIVLMFTVMGAGTSFADGGNLYNGVNAPYAVGDAALNPQTAAQELIGTCQDSASEHYALCIDSGLDESGIGFAFTLDENLITGNIITVQLHNAKFDDFNDTNVRFRLFTYDPAALSGVRPVSEYAVLGTGVGTDSAVFTLTSAINPNELVAMIAAIDTDPTGSYDLEGGYCLIPDASLADGGCVSVSVSVTGPGGSGTALASDFDIDQTDFQCYQQQLVLRPWSLRDGLDEIGVDTIDLFYDRLSWVSPPGDHSSDAFGFGISEDAFSWDDQVLPGDICSVTLTLKGDFSGIVDPATDVTILDDMYTWTSSWNGSELTFVSNGWDGHHARIRFWKDSSGVRLEPGDWTASVSVDVCCDSLCSHTVDLGSEQIGLWNLNGYKFTVPMMRATDVARTFVKFFNKTDDEMLCWVEVYNDGASTLVELDNIPANDGIIYQGEDISTDAGVPLDEPSYEAIFYISASRWDFSMSTFPETRATADKIFCHAFLNVSSGDVWTTRELTVYEELFMIPDLKMLK